LAYRKADKGDVEVLLVRKLRSRSWGIPKGKVKRRLSAAENAAKEAFEEAGVKGHVQQRAAGSFRAVKRVHDQKIVIEVAVHLLEVTKTAKTWSEKAKRETKWCSPEEAANLLREPLLADLCVRLRDQLTP
jgi:ADP-ribose pyrophosphatase YjhB (NUDIX family)